MAYTKILTSASSSSPPFALYPPSWHICGHLICSSMSQTNSLSIPRNAYINNFNPIDLRDDVGKLWGNFVIVERMKSLFNHGIYADFYFWRRNRKEIDLIEEREGKLYAYEIKWRKTKVRPPRVFQEAYPDSQFSVITRENFPEFLLSSSL